MPGQPIMLSAHTETRVHYCTTVIILVWGAQKLREETHTHTRTHTPDSLTCCHRDVQRLLLDRPWGRQHNSYIQFHFSSVNLCFPPPRRDLCPLFHCCLFTFFGSGSTLSAFKYKLGPRLTVSLRKSLKQMQCTQRSSMSRDVHAGLSFSWCHVWLLREISCQSSC